MIGCVTDYRGERFDLPILTAWRFIHSSDGESDFFEVELQYDRAAADVIAKAVKFSAYDGHTLLFTGVIDEYDVTVRGDSESISVSGRGMSAVLMDNEAESKTYLHCSLDDIIEKHVKPYGIEMARADKMDRLKNFTAKSGWSEWRVLTEFCRWAGGITPRMTVDGKLILSAADGDIAAIGEETGVTGIRIRGKRYGVVSSVKVKGNTNGAVTVVKNEDFLSRGGNSRRIVYVPNRTGYDGRRYTGEYVIAQSKKDEFTVTLALAEQFVLRAGDSVSVYLPKMGVEGDFHVKESQWWANGSGCGTDVTLVRR